MSILQNDQNGASIQGFAPNRIVSVSASSTPSLTLDVTNAVAVRVAYPSDYKINTDTTVGTMSGVTVIRKGVTALVFTDATVVEVMD